MSDWKTRGSHDPDDRLTGEVMASLSDWTAEYGLVRLELGWIVVDALLKHVAREQPLDVYIEFIERLAVILGDEAAGIRGVVEEDFRKRAN